MKYLILSVLIFACGFPALAQQKSGDQLINQNIAEWEKRQLMMQIAQTCPILPPYLHFGLLVQLDSLTNSGSFLFRAVQHKSPHFSATQVRAYLDDEVFAPRLAHITALVQSSSCSDNQMKQWAEQAKLYAQYGFHQKAFVISMLEEGYCESDAPQRDRFAEALAAELAVIRGNVPQTEAYEAQVVTMTKDQISRFCTDGSYPTEVISRYLFGEFEKEIVDRTTGEPFRLKIPTQAHSTDPQTVAFRDRENYSGERQLGPYEAWRSVGSCNNTARRVLNFQTGEEQQVNSYEDKQFDMDDVKITLGVGRDGNLAVQLYTSSASSFGKPRLKIVGTLDMVGSAEEVPALPTNLREQKSQESNAGQFKRYVFPQSQLAKLKQPGVKVRVRFGDFGKGINIASSCAYSMRDIFAAASWAMEKNGVGSVIQ